MKITSVNQGKFVPPKPTISILDYLPAWLRRILGNKPEVSCHVNVPIGNFDESLDTIVNSLGPVLPVSPIGQTFSSGKVTPAFTRPTTVVFRAAMEIFLTPAAFATSAKLGEFDKVLHKSEMSTHLMLYTVEKIMLKAGTQMTKDMFDKINPGEIFYALHIHNATFGELSIGKITLADLQQNYTCPTEWVRDSVLENTNVFGDIEIQPASQLSTAFIDECRLIMDELEGFVQVSNNTLKQMEADIHTPKNSNS